MKSKYQYLSDVIAERRNQADAEAVRWAKEDARRAKFTPRTDLHPAVGVLMSDKGVRYYAFVGGVYRESTPEHLAFLLAA